VTDDPYYRATSLEAVEAAHQAVVDRHKELTNIHPDVADAVRTEDIRVGQERHHADLQALVTFGEYVRLWVEHNLAIAEDCGYEGDVSEILPEVTDINPTSEWGTEASLRGWRRMIDVARDQTSKMEQYMMEQYSDEKDFGIID
jgi:hypothetical protein